MSHAMLPGSTHDEAARFGYVVALKQFLMSDIESRMRAAVDAEDRRERFREVEVSLRPLGAYRAWQTLAVTAQEQMWREVGCCVDRQLPVLQQRAAALDGGSVRVDTGFVPPRYLTAVDIHLMPGGYTADRGDDDLRQGAVFDKAAALYHMGRNGGALNDVRGHTLVQHVHDRFPGLAPRRILDLGCTVGHSTVAIARHFPDAEVKAVDVGAALLRYARARAAALGTPVHFSQQSAERTDFADSSFDLVVSSTMLHETSHAALPQILAECRRLLRPGGAMVHLEVPLRFATSSTWTRIRGLFEALHNHEPFWVGAQSADLQALAEQAGFSDVREGYQPAVATADAARAPTFTPDPGPVHAVWYVLSASR